MLKLYNKYTPMLSVPSCQRWKPSAETSYGRTNWIIRLCGLNDNLFVKYLKQQFFFSAWCVLGSDLSARHTVMKKKKRWVTELSFFTFFFVVVMLRCYLVSWWIYLLFGGYVKTWSLNKWDRLHTGPLPLEFKVSMLKSIRDHHI